MTSTASARTSRPSTSARAADTASAAAQKQRRRREMAAMTSKPPYRVPSMEEIRALPWNGFTAASTFSGGGGSSTEYRIAAFKVLYANKFVEAATVETMQDASRIYPANGSVDLATLAYREAQRLVIARTIA